MIARPGSSRSRSGPAGRDALREGGLALVIFDLDGTLADTLGDLEAALSRVLVSEGRAPLPTARVRTMIGLGGRSLLRFAWQATGDPLDEGRIERLFARFIAEYDADLTSRTRLFPGCLAALDALSHHTLAVATNKPERPAKAILRALGVADRFAAILGGDSLPAPKPDPAMIHALRAAHPGPALLVGDSATDSKAAANAGIPMIFVRWGYPGPDGLPPPTDRDIDGFRDLPAMVERVFAGG